MNIHSIYNLQGLWKVISPVGEDNSSAASRESLSTVALTNRGASSEKPEAGLGQSLKLTTMINNLQSDLESDPNVVLYPPFFPIATYQRMELIEKVRVIGEEIQRSSLDESFKSNFSVSSLKDNATDAEISEAIGKLFAVRDRVAGSEPAFSDEIKPGSILSIEV